MKQLVCKTSSLIIDLINSSFINQRFNEKIIVYQYSLPSFLENKDFGVLHNWAKESLNIPYYIHIPSKSIYVWVSQNTELPELSYENKKLSSALFSGHREVFKSHIIVKLLLAKYFELNERFVSNDKFFLYAKLNRRENWATVLSVDIRHNYKNTNDIEFTCIDSATSLQKITVEEFEKYYKRDVVYGQMYKKGQLFFKQLKRNEVKSFEGSLFAKPKKNFGNTKTKINYHSIELAGHETSKAFLLERFITNFTKFINEYGVIARTKELNLTKVNFESKKTSLDINRFNIVLIDGRKVQKDSLSNLFVNTEYIIFTEKKIVDLKANENSLFVMDYSSDDFSDRFSGEHDPYKSFKKDSKYESVVKQGICINPNCFDEDASDKNTSTADYLSYENLSGEDLKRNLGICINQLFLKNILMTKNAALLPCSDILRNHFFCFRNYLLYTEDKILKIEKFETAGDLLEKVSSKFTKLNVEKLYEQISRHHNPFNSSYEFDFLTHKLIFSNESVIEVSDLPERAFYDEVEIKERILNRNKQRPKSDFRSNNSDRLSELFNSYLDEDVSDLFLSYEELKAEYGKGESGFLKSIFNAKNETAFLNFLKANTNLELKGLKAGSLFSTYTGVWYDADKKQYFVGRTHGYKHKQDKGFQMKKIIEHFGNFDEQTFFNLLNVDFIRYKEITVNPFPFKLIEMYDKIISDSSVEEEQFQS